VSGGVARTAGGHRSTVSRRAALRANPEEGSSVVELVLLTPMLMLFVFTIIQIALWYHAKQVVTAAAQEGARTARQEGATAVQGRTAALSYVTNVGGQAVVTPTAVVTRTTTTVTVVVQGKSVKLVPGLNLDVVGRSNAAVEGFRAP